MSKIFNMALCQMRVVDDKEINLKRAEEMIMAAGKKAELVVLPEMFNCPYDVLKFSDYSESVDNSPTLSLISKAAQKAGVYLCAGSIPERDGNKIYNSSFFIDPDGEIIGRYRKIHLFDINVPDEIYFHESETLSGGKDLTVIETDLGVFGIVICYDIRFPELFRLMIEKGAEIILVPGAFNLTTGPAHWKNTIKARAIDNQVFIAAASPSLNPTASYLAYGHSMITNPWGDILVEAGADEEIVYSSVDVDEVYKVREDLPLLKNRRKDLYESLAEKSR